MIKRTLAAALAAILVANALAMLLAAPWWYGAVPGVIATGPFNAHFIADIGQVFFHAEIGTTQCRCR